MWITFIYGGIATVLVVMVLAGLQARGKVKAAAFESVLLVLGAAWLIAGMRWPTVTNGSVTVEVYTLGTLLIVYAAGHWIFHRWFSQYRDA